MHALFERLDKSKQLSVLFTIVSGNCSRSNLLVTKGTMLSELCYQILVKQKALKLLVPEVHPEFRASRTGNDRSLGGTEV